MTVALSQESVIKSKPSKSCKQLCFISAPQQLTGMKSKTSVKPEAKRSCLKQLRQDIQSVSCSLTILSFLHLWREDVQKMKEMCRVYTFLQFCLYSVSLQHQILICSILIYMPLTEAASMFSCPYGNSPEAGRWFMKGCRCASVFFKCVLYSLPDFFFDYEPSVIFNLF